MSDYTELLTAVSSGAAFGIALAAALIVRGNLTVQFKRRTEPGTGTRRARAATTPTGES